MKLFRMTLYVMLLAAFLMMVPVDPVRADITAYDAFGNFLGIFVGNSSTATGQIYMPSVDRFLHVNMNTGEIVGQDLYYESEDCSGDTAYAAAEAAYRIIRNGSHYFTGVKTLPANVEVNSALRSLNLSCESFPETRLVVPVNGITLPFLLPVPVPLRFEIEKKIRR